MKFKILNPPPQKKKNDPSLRMYEYVWYPPTPPPPPHTHTWGYTYTHFLEANIGQHYSNDKC